jgi:hypothetical protein
VDAGAGGVEDVKTILDLGGGSDLEIESGVAGGEAEDDGGGIEAVVGELLAGVAELRDFEAGLVLEEEEFVDEALDGVLVGGPVVGGAEEPVVVTFFEDEWRGDVGGVDLDASRAATCRGRTCGCAGSRRSRRRTGR